MVHFAIGRFGMKKKNYAGTSFGYIFGCPSYTLMQLGECRIFINKKALIKISRLSVHVSVNDC